MNVRAPQSLRNGPDTDPLTAALNQEILAEKAGTYGRLMRRFETSLAALKAFDKRCGSKSGGNDLSGERDVLVAKAAEALWFVVIQRDLCGFGHTARFLADLNVPLEVQNGLGVRPVKKSGVQPRVSGA